MTTNQTIDGVLIPRELAKRLAVPMLRTPEYLFDHRDALDELRALLDAPASDPDCIHCFGGGRDPFGAVCGCAAPKPAAQPQGEPVAWQFYQDGKWWNGMDQNRHKENTIEAGYLVRDLYAGQPAPVAVVLPTQEDFERLIIRRDGSVNVSVLGKSRFYNDPTIDREYFVWLTCLDEVTRLNPSL